jgi:hypothetical protein
MNYRFISRIRAAIKPLFCVYAMQTLYAVGLAKPNLIHQSSNESIPWIVILIAIPFALLSIIVGIWGYFIPYLIARRVGNKNTKAFFIWNLLTGWTGVAWYILVWLALRD